MVSRRGVIKGIGGAAGLGALMAVGAGAGEMSASKRYRVPAESSPHLRTFMQWPVNRDVYPDPVFLGMIQRAVARIANAIVAFEPVVMLMDKSRFRGAARLLSQNVEFWDVATDDLWCRDSGPVFVQDDEGNLAVSHLNFNGWGNKQVHRNDGLVSSEVAALLGLELRDNGIVGEGGGIESDGQGTLMAHESSWVNVLRHKGTRAKIETLLLEAHGGEKLIWAPGLRGADITDYHIDSLVRFVKPGTALIQLPKHILPGDPWSRAAYETYDILKNATDARSEKLELVVVPDPVETRVTSDDFVASYVNYYVCNGAVIMSEFGDRSADDNAAAIIGALYPGREIVALNVDVVGEIGGGVHCTTQQQPLEPIWF